MYRKLTILFILVLGCAAYAQKPDEVLATAAGRSFTIKDLSPEVQSAVTSLPTRLFGTRTAILEQMVNQRLLDAEAKATGVSPGRIVAAERAKVPQPTEAEIKAVYDANRESLHNHSLEDSRKQIVAYLRREPEQKLLSALYTRLKTKYKYAAGKGINAGPLAPTDVVATVNQQAITAKEFEDLARIAEHEMKVTVADLLLEDLNQAVFGAMVEEEAKSRKTDPSTLIGKEITDKMKDFSNEERISLEDAFVKSLSTKYKPAITFKAPEPIVQKVSADDDPSIGPANAPVTIIMFTDLQCPACAATHPVLKQALAAYAGKVRLVVRDYPLESIHDHAFAAAKAAAAAGAQGKFFEYAEILYKNQGAQDTPSLLKYAADIGLNVKQFELDFNSEKTAAEIRKDQADADSYIVNSTPTIFVNGIRVRDLSLDSFKSAIERALAK